VYVNTDRIAVYHFYDVGGNVDFGVNLGRTGQVRLGYVNTRRRVTVQTGISDLPAVDRRIPDIDVRDAGIVASATYDSRDTDTFARHGMAAALEFVQSDESLGAERNWHRIEAGLRRAVPIARNAMSISLAGGTHLGNHTLPADRAFSLGGPRTLAAYQFDELRVRGYWLADVSFLWSIRDLVPIKDQVIYGGLALQTAGLYDRVDRVEDGEVYSASAYVGGPTPIGTFTVGLGGASDSWGFWLSLGRPIGRGSILDDGLFR